MPTATNLSIDYSGILDTAIGPTHGLTLDEIRRAEPPAQALIKRIEAERGSGQHRYRDLPGDGAMIRQVKSAAARYRQGCENLVVLGIGGSALGNVALQTALNPPYHNLLPAAKRRGPRLFVMDNVDPVQFGNLVELLGPALRKTVFNVISKSGETAETAAQFLIVRDLLTRKLGRKGLLRQTLVTTDPDGGTLRETVQREGFDSLPVPPGVGGRFTVLSAVGLFSAAMCGIDIGKLASGAAQMGKRVAETNVRKNPAALLALLLHASYVRGKRMHVMMPYSYQLRDLADWYRQMWAESLGKCVDTKGRPVVVGPTPIRALGATDQHSQVQLYREGPADKVFLFLEVEKFARDVKIPRVRGGADATRYLEGATLGKLLSAEKRATEAALLASQRPCLTIRFPVVSESAVGQFVMLWEAATTLMGGLLDVNPYDQPAVQLGKDYTYALMGKPGYEKQAREMAKSRRGAKGAAV